MIRPPAVPSRILARALKAHPAGAAILGDLNEDFARVLEARGAIAARVWYWREAVGLVLGRLADRLSGGVRNLFRRRLEGLVEDGAYALGMLRRSPGFVLFTAAVIGVGVGAVTTVFSVLKPLTLALPFEDVHELVWISNVEEGSDDGALSAVSSRTNNLIDFRERATSFSGLTGYDAFFAGRPYALTGVGEPLRLAGVGVAHDFLEVLRVEPLLGRSFTSEEAVAGGPKAIILAHGFWRTRLAADPGIVGRALTLNDVPRTVVGVLPPEFDFDSVFAPGTEVDFLLPFVVSRDNAFQGNVLHLIGRLREGVAPRAAQAELSTILGVLWEEEPGRWGLGARLVTLQDHVAGPFRHALLLLAAAAGTLLLIVCVNVSSLILARTPARAREMAVRKAVGASRRRLVRQLVLESLVVALAGAAIGCGLASVATSVVRAAGQVQVPLLSTVVVDVTALAVALGVSVATGIAVGILPALLITEGGEAEALRAASRSNTATRGARRLQDTLVVAEVGLACVLLVIGGLMMASFRTLLAVDLGFEPANTVAWRLQPGLDFENRRDRAVFYARVAERLEALPGIDRVGLVDALPLGRNRTWPLRILDVPADQQIHEEIFPHIVDPGYRSAMGIRLLAGRDIAATDRDDAAPVVLLNQSGARRIFGGEQQALGARVAAWGDWEWEVVGVVEDVRHVSPESGSGIEAYFPLAQMPDFTTVELVVRSMLPVERVASVVSTSLARVDPAMPTGDFWSLSGTVRGAVSDRAFALGVFAAFAVAAVFLAGLGIYGVLSRHVAERKPEIAIRMALGASASHIMGTVIRRVLALAMCGVAVGWTSYLLLSGLLRSMLFGVEPTDPGALVGTAALLLGIAMLAAVLPARRAVSVQASSPLKVDS